MTYIGQLSLLGAFVSSGYAATACVVGWWRDHRAVSRSGVVAGMTSVGLLSTALAILASGLLVKDFRFAYVAQYASRHLPWYYTLSALWVGQEGSLLLWSWFSAGLSLLFRFWPRRDRSSLREPTYGVLMGLCCFLIATMVFAADPLAPNQLTPREGAGLSPLLQHPAMLIHPPIIFLAYSAWAIPFALAVTALATGRLDTAWIRDARPWALFAWIVLGSGILIGAKWAYVELGWGGYWGWDPVENGSLLPWLTGTASLHGMMAWRNRLLLKKSALVLTIATFGLCNFATFLTRSGIFSSLHAFSQSSIGWLFLGWMVLLVLGGVILVGWRRRQLHPENSITTLWCRESMIVVNLVALIALAFVICGGTVGTVFSEAVWKRKIVVGLAYYNNALIPTGLMVLATTAWAPLLRWGKAPTRSQQRMLWGSGVAGGLTAIAVLLLGIRHPLWLTVTGLSSVSLVAFAGAVYLDIRPAISPASWREILRSLRGRRRQYAGFVIHLGLFCLALGVTASSLTSRQHEAVLGENETLRWAGRRVRLVKVHHRELPDKLVAEAQLEVSQGSALPVTLAPAQHLHLPQNEWTSEVSIHSGWSGDFYTILHNGEGQGRVRLTFVENPLLRWIWLGGWIMGAGALVALWPAKSPSVDRSIRPSERGAVGHSRPLVPARIATGRSATPVATSHAGQGLTSQSPAARSPMNTP